MNDPKTQAAMIKLINELPDLSKEQIENRRHRLEQQQKRFDNGVKVAEELSNIANVMSNDDEKRGFMLRMKCTHRTLQQASFQLFLTWVYFIAQEYTNNDIDLRNEEMVKTAKKITKALGDYGYSLPMI